MNLTNTTYLHVFIFQVSKYHKEANYRQQSLARCDDTVVNKM